MEKSKDGRPIMTQFPSHVMLSTSDADLKGVISRCTKFYFHSFNILGVIEKLPPPPSSSRPPTRPPT